MPKEEIISMPEILIGTIHNGSCPDPCDMLVGPCACGATHHWDEWQIIRKQLTKTGWVNTAIPT
jgi:hypothetical protein